MFAVWRIGAINVPLNIYLRGHSLEHQIRSSEPRIVVADPHGVAALSEALGESSDIELIVATEQIASSAIDCGWPVERVEEFAVDITGSLTWGSSAEMPDCAMIIYTSGTTGASKGCVVSHRYVRHWGHALKSFVQPSAAPVIFTSAALYHVMGNLAISLAIEHGCTVVFETEFHASTFFRRAGEVGATMAFGVGWLAKALLAQPESPNDRNHQLRTVFMGPVSQADRALFLDRFGSVVHSQIYGQTECVPIAMNPPGTEEGIGSMGKPSDCLEVQVLDDDGFPVPVGAVGEISVRPRHPGAMFDGYWRDRERTLESFEGLWHHSGDMGRFDESGHLYYVDRKKDSMRRRGENVSAFEVENTIFRHPAIADVAVHGVRLEKEVDDAIKACLILKPGHELELDQFAEFLAKELPYFAVPRFIEIFEEFPKNATGRIMKDTLRAQPQSTATIDLELLGHGVRRDQRRASS
jgi:crotonobetaine/carnitine-CoA ligase